MSKLVRPKNGPERDGSCSNVSEDNRLASFAGRKGAAVEQMSEFWSAEPNLLDHLHVRFYAMDGIALFRRAYD